MTKIIHATITGRRLFITFTDGTLEVGLPQKDIPSFLDLIPLMIGSRITERLLDRDKNFLACHSPTMRRRFINSLVLPLMKPPTNLIGLP